MRRTHADASDAISRVSSICALPTLLQLVSELTDLGFIAVARVTELMWTACAVHDVINFGIAVGTPLDVGTTFSAEVRVSRTPVVIEQASIDPKYRDHLTPKLYGLESIVTVPIVTADGEYFGSLCGADRRPTKVAEPWVMTLFNRIAHVIAIHLDATQPNPKSVATRLKDEAPREAADRSAGSTPHEAVDLDTVLTRVMMDLRSAHPHRKIISNIAIRRTLRCDPAGIAQLTSSLLESALAQAAPFGPVSISATIEDKSLSIDVWNAGEPIPMQRLGRILNSPAYRSVVDAHEGSISATSSRVLGTQFLVRIPATA